MPRRKSTVREIAALKAIADIGPDGHVQGFGGYLIGDRVERQCSGEEGSIISLSAEGASVLWDRGYSLLHFYSDIRRVGA